VTTFLTAYALVLFILQRVFLGVAAMLALVCLIDWLVRTRRISPFSALARFMRRTVDPLLAPVERRVLRSGGTPGSVPMWALVGVVLLGIGVISLLQFVGGQLVAFSYAMQGGTRTMVAFAIGAILGLLQVAIMVRVIASWIPSLSPWSPWVRWAFVITDPIIVPLRRIIPPLGMVDITPMVAWLLIAWVVPAILAPLLR
jgi:YggT family protein